MWCVIWPQTFHRNPVRRVSIWWLFSPSLRDGVRRSNDWALTREKQRAAVGKTWKYATLHSKQEQNMRWCLSITFHSKYCTYIYIYTYPYVYIYIYIIKHINLSAGQWLATFAVLTLHVSTSLVGNCVMISWLCSLLVMKPQQLCWHGQQP